MSARLISAIALAAAASIWLLPDTAEAGSRWRLHFLQPYYYTYYPRPHDLYGDDEDYDEYDSPPLAYYEPDDRYYEPEYRGQDDEPAYVAPKKKKSAKTVPVAKPVVKKSVASTAKKPAPGSAAMTCDRAEKIVAGYGFTGVKPTSCAGQVYAFNATRSGKSYVIKLSAASGELTEVKKVQ